MVRTAVLSAVAILAGCGVLPGVGIDPALPAQSANRSEASPELQFTVLEPTMHSPGQKCWFELVVRNPGNQPVCIPISGAPPTLASVLKVRAGLVGGGEEVTYPPYAPDPSGAVALVTILPGTEERLRTWFIPWVPGEYEWTLTLENHLASRTELLRTGSGGSERWVSLPIPNAWVGRSLFTGRIVPLEDGPAGGAEVRIARPGIPDIGPGGIRIRSRLLTGLRQTRSR